MPGPDPKRGKRIVDRDAYAAARIAFDECAACRRPPSNVHHIVPRGSPHFGDDVVENLLLLCGSGTTGCHGAHHGNPYRPQPIGRLGPWDGERRDAEWVARRIGAHLKLHRPDAIEYVLAKLGDQPGRAFLERTYYAILEDGWTRRSEPTTPRSLAPSKSATPTRP